jgi:hypothetical protein
MGNLTVYGSRNYRMRTGEGKGSWILTFRRLKPVLLLPRVCLGEMGPPLVRGFDGRPNPVNTFRGGAGAAVVNLSSSGVGGSLLTAGASYRWLLAGRLTSSSLTCMASSRSMPTASLSTLFFLGAEVGGKGPPLPPRGPVPSCAKPMNFFAAGAGSAFLLTTGTASTVSGLSFLVSPWEMSESLRARSG